MSLNPLKVLKRKLEDESTALTKRLRLAKNVIHTHNFPLVPKERVITEWLESILIDNKLNVDEFRNVLGWTASTDHISEELKSKIIELSSRYIQSHNLSDGDTPHIIAFLENAKIASQLNNHIEEFCSITRTLLRYLKNNESKTNLEHSKTLLNNTVKYFKESKKKLDLIIKILNGDHIETIFEFLDFDETKGSVLNLCQTVLFPMSKKTFFVQFLRTILQKETIDELLQEKGDNIKSVLKVMSAFFTFPNGRTATDPSFIQKFINTFVCSFKTESQLVFSFYIMVASSLNFQQAYTAPAMKMPVITFAGQDEKVKRQIFLDMLKVLLDNEINIAVTLTDMMSENKVHVKKNFASFLQYLLMGQLKLDGKLDRISLDIIKTALKLDPTLIEQKIDKILPPLMVAKKNNKQSLKSYTEMLNSLLEILFKLSRGVGFVNKILPHVKLLLETGNTEQFELRQNLKEALENGTDGEKLQLKIITGSDVFPQECVETYGRLSSVLMFRQSSELFVLLQKDFEEHCLMMLEEGFVSPSIITLTSVLSAILSDFLSRNKMADHAVPRPTAHEFWARYKEFETDTLRRFGESVLKLNYNAELAQAFLNLTSGYLQLKMLHVNNSNEKTLNFNFDSTTAVFDFHCVLACLDSQQWIELVNRIDDEDTKLGLNNLLLLKTTAAELFSVRNPDAKTDTLISESKTQLIQHIAANTNILIENRLLPATVFHNLDKQQLKQVSKTIVKNLIDQPDLDILNNEIQNNRSLLNALSMECLRNLTKLIEGSSGGESPLLSKELGKSSFDMTTFFSNDNGATKFFENLTAGKDIDDPANYISILKKLQIHNLHEDVQLLVIFVLLALKRLVKVKKSLKTIDALLVSIFELSPKNPDLFKLFPIDYMFEFEKCIFIDLLTVKLKSVNSLFIVKCLLESAVKKVKNDSAVVKVLVKTIIASQKLKKENLEIDYFADKVFQISCLILPIIAKEKRILTSSAYRSILAELQENMHKSLLKSLKRINFDIEKANFDAGNTEGGISESNLATLNAMEAFSLTLSKYCETTNAEELQNLDCLWSGLEYLVNNAIKFIEATDTKTQHVDMCVQLLNVVLRNAKKLESHNIFNQKDAILVKIWQSVKMRVVRVYEEPERKEDLEEIALTVKLVCELSSTDIFVGNFVNDMFSLMVLKKPTSKLDSTKFLTAHQTSKFLWACCLKANILEKKCLALSKSFYRTCKNITIWIWQNYETNQNGGELMNVCVDDVVCQMLKEDLDAMTEVVNAAKKIPLNYKFLDAVFETLHMVLFVMGRKTTAIRCDIAWREYLGLCKAVLRVLNSLVQNRDELLEDRWPCYLQVYRALITSLCEKSSATGDKNTEEDLADVGHSVEKLTQAIAKRKSHISRLAAYTVGDICAHLETSGPARSLRQHLENSIALLIQASDSTYAIAFLRRTLAGAPGQITMTNMYSNYKKYHKYVGNA